MKISEIINWYSKKRPIYKRLSSKVESLLAELFETNNISYHIITSRTKSIESVEGKIKRNKYNKPKEQIQDFSGIRIISYVEDELETICNIIEDTFEIDKANSSNKSEALGLDKVGYKSIHYIASLDKQRLKLPEYNQYDGKCFEIQVRTILQHAWAEIEHDRNYKFSGKLPVDLGRRFKILAGVLEMADREFNNISNDIDYITQNTREETTKGKLDIAISSTTLSQYFATKFKNIIDSGFTLIPDTDKEDIHELEKFGLKTLKDLDKIIPKGFDKSLQKLTNDSEYESGLAKRILIIHDYDKYFSEVTDTGGDWVWAGEDDNIERKFFLDFDVDWDEIERKYNVMFSIN